MKPIIKNMTASLFALGAAASFAGQASAEECLELGGVAVANFFFEGEDQPLVISGGLMGTFHNAAGRILSQRETPTGLVLDIEHYFGRADGGALYTQDTAVLTAVPGREGRYMIEITYDVQQEVTRGTLAGYDGQFRSYGLVDMRDPNTFQGLVRYSGEICR